MTHHLRENPTPRPTGVSPAGQNPTSMMDWQTAMHIASGVDPSVHRCQGMQALADRIGVLHQKVAFSKSELVEVRAILEDVRREVLRELGPKGGSP